MMPDIADECGSLASTFEFEEHVTRRMTRRCIDLDEVIEPIRSAADEVRASMLKDRYDAFAKRTELRRPFFRIGVDPREIIDVRLRKHITGIGKCRNPLAVSLLRVPADVIVMQMSAHHQINLVRPSPCGGEPLEVGLVEHVPERAAGFDLVVAAAGIDEDFLAAHL